MRMRVGESWQSRIVTGDIFGFTLKKDKRMSVLTMF